MLKQRTGILMYKEYFFILKILLIVNHNINILEELILLKCELCIMYKYTENIIYKHIKKLLELIHN